MRQGLGETRFADVAAQGDAEKKGRCCTEGSRREKPVRRARKRKKDADSQDVPATRVLKKEQDNRLLNREVISGWSRLSYVRLLSGRDNKVGQWGRLSCAGLVWSPRCL